MVIIRYLMQRPISVFMTLLGVLMLSVIALNKVPISLVPNTAVPKVTIRVDHAMASGDEIAHDVLEPLRVRLSTLSYLKEMTTTAYDHHGAIDLRFEYDVDMEKGIAQIQSKIDQWIPSMPSGYSRPVVLSHESTDIPMVKIQVVASGLSSSQLYPLVGMVFKKSFESLPGIAYVDYSGISPEVLEVVVDVDRLNLYGISLARCRARLLEEKIALGSLMVKDGKYRFPLRIENSSPNIEDRLSTIHLMLSDGSVIPITEFCKIGYRSHQDKGDHFFDQQKGVVMQVHRQSQARVMDVMSSLRGMRRELEEKYPNVSISFTEDQTNLLHESILSLESSLLLGGLFAFILLFLFLGRSYLPIIMSLVIPISLVLTMGIFYLFDISINIISIGGVSLGIGMLIDNAIIVMDNIGAYQRRWSSKGVEGCFQACVQGTSEVVGPLISSVLTTLAVFIPLIYLSGVAGFLFQQQAFALTATLVSSLLVSFIVVPLLYYILYVYHYKRGKISQTTTTLLYQWVEQRMTRLHDRVMGHQSVLLWIGIVWITFGLYPLMKIERKALPNLTEQQMVLWIDWNKKMTKTLLNSASKEVSLWLKPYSESVSVDVGTTTFEHQTAYVPMEHSHFYVRLKKASDKKKILFLLEKKMRNSYAFASWQWRAAENTLTQLVSSDQIPFIDIRFRTLNHDNSRYKISQIKYIHDFADNHGLKVASSGAVYPALSLIIDRDRCVRKGIAYQEVVSKLYRLVGRNSLMNLRSEGGKVEVLLQEASQGLSSIYQSEIDGVPLDYLIQFEPTTMPLCWVSDKEGRYISLYSMVPIANIDKILDDLEESPVIKSSFRIGLKGEYFSYKAEQRHMIQVIVLALLILYFILAAQFESFVQPLVVIVTLPLGMVGSFWCLWLSGQTLNVMAFIGIIVMLGVTVNDAILKIDTINTMRRRYPNRSVVDVVDEACELRLKPILMTTLTTVLALLPILFGGGLGNELQQPLALSVIGGLSIGTFMAIFWVPALYLQLTRWTEKGRQND
ncbi:efflux RND transporter permease subunit [Halosquirtibacter xylanolyticus]|uniref:efflux RND transporter permease subunit n=1 Tax=Halosquirtibacter xylanolyticus TaxID=3374599 RepID=UPI003747F6B1|nr:efflux RND transporter permease subunit [Prolixibacteraceae bacterium]